MNVCLMKNGDRVRYQTFESDVSSITFQVSGLAVRTAARGDIAGLAKCGRGHHFTINESLFCPACDGPAVILGDTE